MEERWTIRDCRAIFKNINVYNMLISETTMFHWFSSEDSLEKNWSNIERSFQKNLEILKTIQDIYWLHAQCINIGAKVLSAMFGKVLNLLITSVTTCFCNA